MAAGYPLAALRQGLVLPVHRLLVVLRLPTAARPLVPARHRLAAAIRALRGNKYCHPAAPAASSGIAALERTTAAPAASAASPL
jgi:hypothetical protein